MRFVNVLITLITVAITTAVGIQVAKVQIQADAEILCAGFRGCGALSVAEVAPAVAMGLVMLGVIVMGSRGWLPRP